MLAGGDVSGILRSTDGGRSWHAVNAGVSGHVRMKVAAILYSPVAPGRVFAGVGDGATGGFLQSDDSGATWRVRSTVPHFHGQTPKVTSLPQTHPRSTGNLIAQDPITGAIYVATFDQGVMRSDDGGVQWKKLGLQGHYLRSIALDPLVPDVLYAASYGRGIYKSTDARRNGALSVLPAAPSTVEELAISNGVIYAAAGPAGVFTSDDGGGTWRLRIGPTVTGSNWMSIAAWTSCSGHSVVYAGAHRATPNTIVRSTDRGQNWVSVTSSASRIHANVGGPGGPEWWLAPRTRLLLGGSNSTPAQITLRSDPADRCAEPGVLVAGRSGIWGSTNSGGDWYPLMGGLAATWLETLALDSAAASTVHVAPYDWTYLFWTHAAAAVSSPVIQAAGAAGFDVAVDASVSPSRVYIATGNRDSNTQGGIFSSASPAVATSWVNEGLSSRAGSKRPLAIAVGRSGRLGVLLAAVDGAGIYRKVGSTWSKVNGVAMSKANPPRPVQMIWPGGTTIVYLFERRSGVWRSTDAGASWSNIWAKTSSSNRRGYIATDATGGTLWVSTDSSLYRIDDARSGTVAAGKLKPVPVLTVPSPGPVAVGRDGAVYLATKPSGSMPAQLLRSDDRGATWSDIADDSYRNTVLLPSRIAVDAEGGLWLALAGNGLLRGTVRLTAPARRQTSPPPGFESATR